MPMINRPEDHRFMVALLIVFLALDIPVTACWRGFFLPQPASSIPCIDLVDREPDLHVLEERPRGPANMSSESKTIRMRAYRITEIRRRENSVWIVLEHIERKLFRRSCSHVGSLGVPTHD